jgi:hypothetical protein
MKISTRVFRPPSDPKLIAWPKIDPIMDFEFGSIAIL